LFAKNISIEISCRLSVTASPSLANPGSWLHAGQCQELPAPVTGPCTSCHC